MRTYLQMPQHLWRYYNFDVAECKPRFEDSEIDVDYSIRGWKAG